MTRPWSFLSLIISLFCSQHIRMNKHQVLTRLTPSFLLHPRKTEGDLLWILKENWITCAEVCSPVNPDPFIDFPSMCARIANKPEACSLYRRRFHRFTHNALLLITSSRSQGPSESLAINCENQETTYIHCAVDLFKIRLSPEAASTLRVF